MVTKGVIITCDNAVTIIYCHSDNHLLSHYCHTLIVTPLKS